MLHSFIIDAENTTIFIWEWSTILDKLTTMTNNNKAKHKVATIQS